eukprot:SAG11_NODE_208_length_12354_cov_19.490167_14_plen_80_part_00
MYMSRIRSSLESSCIRQLFSIFHRAGPVLVVGNGGLLAPCPTHPLSRLSTKRKGKERKGKGKKKTQGHKIFCDDSLSRI